MRRLIEGCLGANTRRCDDAVTVGLTIGNNTGSITVNANFE